MLRTILGVVAGFVGWWMFAGLLNRGLHMAWPAYAAADTQAMAFDLPMKIARLAESAVASILAALVARLAAPASRYAAPISGALLLILFLPVHYTIWTKFPVWYHACFLSSLVVQPLLVQRLAGAARTVAAAR